MCGYTILSEFDNSDFHKVLFWLINKTQQTILLI